jgi:hypothetical protein
MNNQKISPDVAPPVLAASTPPSPQECGGGAGKKATKALPVKIKTGI